MQPVAVDFDSPPFILHFLRNLTLSLPFDLTVIGAIPKTSGGALISTTYRHDSGRAEAGMAQDLPQEIVDLIVGEFRLDDPIDKHTLTQCGLVCKSWHRPSRYGLFANVKLTDRTVEPFLDIVHNSIVPIAMSVRSLTLSLEGEPADAPRIADGGEGAWGLDGILRRLGPLPLVTALRVCVKEDVLLWTLTLLADTFSNISTLVFSNVTLRMGSLFSAVCAFPLLRRLELDRVRSFHDDPGFLEVAYHFPSQWNSLTVMSFGVSELFETFLALKPIPVLSALSLSAETDRTKTGLRRYLFHIGDALHILRLEFESSPLERLFIPFSLFL